MEEAYREVYMMRHLGAWKGPCMKCTGRMGRVGQPYKLRGQCFASAPSLAGLFTSAKLQSSHTFRVGPALPDDQQRLPGRAPSTFVEPFFVRMRPEVLHEGPAKGDRAAEGMPDRAYSMSWGACIPLRVASSSGRHCSALRGRARLLHPASLLRGSLLR